MPLVVIAFVLYAAGLLMGFGGVVLAGGAMALALAARRTRDGAMGACRGRRRARCRRRRGGVDARGRRGVPAHRPAGFLGTHRTPCGPRAVGGGARRGTARRVQGARAGAGARRELSCRHDDPRARHLRPPRDGAGGERGEGDAGAARRACWPGGVGRPARASTPCTGVTGRSPARCSWRTPTISTATYATASPTRESCTCSRYPGCTSGSSPVRCARRRSGADLPSPAPISCR